MRSEQSRAEIGNNDQLYITSNTVSRQKRRVGRERERERKSALILCNIRYALCPSTPIGDDPIQSRGAN